MLFAGSNLEWKTLQFSVLLCKRHNIWENSALQFIGQNALFSFRFFLCRHWRLTGHSYSTLPIPPGHKHSDSYLQLFIWDDYHISLMAAFVFTRMLFDEIYHIIELPFNCLIDDAMFVCLFTCSPIKSQTCLIISIPGRNIVISLIFCMEISCKDSLTSVTTTCGWIGLGMANHTQFCLDLLWEPLVFLG